MSIDLIHILVALPAIGGVVLICLALAFISGSKTNFNPRRKS